MTHVHRLAAFCCVLAFAIGTARAQPTPDQQAEMALASARKALTERNFPVAAARFREFLGKFGGHKEASAAKFGLALSLLEGAEKDRNYGEAQQLLTPLAGDKSFPEQALAAHHLGHSYRSQGMNELAKASGDANEIRKNQEAAKGRFEKALATFAQALPLFRAAAKEPGDKELTPAWESVARAHCDLAELQLRVNKPKDARTAAEPFLKDPVLSRSRHRDFGRYLYASAAFQLGDMTAAQKTLTMLAPFASPDFGPHARYLLARTHHLAGERTDALAQYEAAIADQKKNVETAAALLKQPQKFNNDPVKLAELQSVVKQPAPDHIARANFYLGVLLYEAARFAEAKAKFQAFAKTAPQSPLAIEADLRVGFCQVQLKEWKDALKTLRPIATKEKLADQALLWIAKAQIGAAPDAAVKWPEYKNAVSEAINSLRAAYESTQKLTGVADLKMRRGEILLEIADQLQAIKEPKEAAGTYQKILNEKLLPEREEEIAVRLAQAFHLAGDWSESDARCQAFLQKFPRSTLAAAAAFTFAENAFFRAGALEKAPAAPERDKQLNQHYDEALKRFQVVLDRYPEHPKVLLARHSIGLTLYRKGEFDKAYKVWQEIPALERGGELAQVSFLMADCVLRQTPATLAADADALAAGKLDEQLKTAIELLDGFLGANAKDANAPDAFLKYGLCLQRRAGLLSDAKEKQAVLAAARGAYDRLSKTFPTHPLRAYGIFERAKVITQQGDTNAAMNELRRFTTDPLRQSPIAPMAMINLATLLRGQGKPVEAADILRKVREQSETALSQDPDRASWVPLLRFHLAAALRESGKLAEARGLFELVVKESPKSAEGVEAALRFGQALKEEGQIRLEAGKKLVRNPKEAAQGQKTLDEGYKLVADAVAYLEAGAEQFKAEPVLQEPRARMLYEAAWGMRILSEPEIEAAKLALAKKFAPPSAKAPPPVIALDQVPLQPSEKKARGYYKNLIDQFGDVPLSVDARFELAELLAQRNELDAASALLSEALDKEPGADLTEKIRLRQGAILAAKGNFKGALAQFEAVAKNPKSQNIGWAQYRAAEVNLQNKEYPEAVKRLVMFRDNGKYQNVAGLSDRALLRLGHAYALLKAWGESYQAFERCANVSPNGPWYDDARYGMGWAMQQQRNFDGAVNWYAQVVSRSATELAAKAQYQIGVCRMEQKRFPEAAKAFMVIPTTYDYPELSAAALLEASQAYREANNREQSVRLLEQVVRDYPGTPFAAAAKERLAGK
jgi:TolA-binding protein